MATRTITGTLVDEAAQPVSNAELSITLLTPLAYRETDVVLRETESAITDEDGEFTIALAVPTDGSYLYRCRLPDGQVFNFSLADGAATTLSEIMAAAVAESTGTAGAMASLIAAHNASGTAHDDIRTAIDAVESSVSALDYDPGGTAASLVSAHEALTTAAHGGLVASSDSRLTDARTPTAHAASHADGADDEITPSAIGAESALGNPASNGYVLSSTTGGVRSWIAMAVSSVSLSLAQTWTALQTFSAGIVAAWIAPAANSTAAFQVRKADKTTAVLNVDTTTPKVTVSDQLTIEGTAPSFSVIGAGTTAFYVKKYQDSVFSPNAGFYRARGSASVPTAVLTGDYLGDFTWSGLRTGGYETTFATMTVQKEATSRGASLAVNLANTGAPATVLKLWHDGGVSMPQLPTSDPAVAGRLWNDGGTLKISAG